MRWLLTIAVILAGCALDTAHADSLVLKNKDVLSGQLRSVGKGTLFFRADIGGAMMVPADRVKGLSTDAPFDVTLTNSQVLTGRFTSQDGKTCLEDPATGQLRVIDLAQIANIQPAQPRKTEVTTPTVPDKQTWSGAAQVGVRSHFGAKDYTAPSLELELERTGASTGFAASAEAALDDEGGFPRYFHVGAEWDLAPLQSVYPLIELEAEREATDALSLGVTAAAGIGRRFIQSENLHLAAVAGLAFTTEEYDIKPLHDARNDYGWASARKLDLRDRYDREQDLNLRIQLRYSQQIFANGTLDSSLLLQPSLTDLGDIEAASESAVRFPLGSDLQLKLNLLIDYDDDLPFADLDKWNTSVGASVGWRF